MQEHYDNPGTGATAESTLDELFGTLWAISVITPTHGWPDQRNEAKERRTEA